MRFTTKACEFAENADRCIDYITKLRSEAGLPELVAPGI